MSRSRFLLYVATAVAVVFVGRLKLGAVTPRTNPSPAGAPFDDITVRGCVERDAASSVPNYVLIEATARDRRLYRLRPGPGIDVAAHVGHTVEVVGAADSTRSGAHAETEITVRTLTVIKTSC